MTSNRYRIGDICELVRGTSPTLKTLPGQYPLVVTADFRRTSESWQLEGPAVCVPLVSSTGHGDAALHRVHYQDGKFALANLLVALLPKDHAVCDTKFLYHLLMVKKNELLVPLMLGTANVSLKERDIAGVEISLPPVAEQRRIVARIEELAAKINEARRLRDITAAEMRSLNAAFYRVAFSTQRNLTTIGQICEVIDPNPSHRYPEYVAEGVPIVSSSEFRGDDAIDPRLAKCVPEAFYKETLGRYGVGEGDLIFSRKGKVGYARLHPKGIIAMTHTLCVIKPDRQRVDPRYLLHFARSPLFLGGLTETMNPNVGVPTLGLHVIRNARIPLGTMSEQQCVVARLDALGSHSEVLKNLQSRTRIELGALLPSILDKAFNGEL